MSKILVFAGALLITSAVAAYPQKTPDSNGKTKATTSSVAVKTIDGNVKANGNKLTFIADQDGKPWNLLNPQLLKGYQGDHVQITGHIFTNHHLIHIHTVKVLKPSIAKAQ